MSKPLSDERRPLVLAAELDTLDESEIIEGYLDGLKNERCGGNRSRSYWHGWRNGMVDGKHAKIDASQGLLAKDVFATGRLHERRP